MSDYLCPRCGHLSTTKSNFKVHLLRKKICPPINSDISIEEIFEQIKIPSDKFSKNYSCIHCNKKYSYLSGLSAHCKICPEKSNISEKIKELTAIIEQIKLENK